MKTMVGGVIAYVCLLAPAFGQEAPAWRGYAGDAQHTSTAPAESQPLLDIHWKAPIDLDPPYDNGELLIHYASPMITASNTVLLPVRTGASDMFRMEARSGATGKLMWKQDTDFIMPPHDWRPSFPAHLTAQNRLYYAGAGGTVYFRDAPDLKKGAHGQIAFFGDKKYRKNKAAYDQSVEVNTPITADDAGNVYFGFDAATGAPNKLKSGIARIGVDGKGTWIAASDAATDSTIIGVAQSCAPAISHDQSTIYIAVIDNDSAGYLLGLDSTTLQQKYKVRLVLPEFGIDGTMLLNSSAAPTVGPDGDVYFGVFEQNSLNKHNGRGWLMHYSADLSQTKTPGSFGWDDAASIVPAAAVPSYSGTSPYLLMTKYNNYYGVGHGDGHNEIAILDPGATQTDRFSTVTVMKEIMTIENPNHVRKFPKGVVYEWCINAAAVDVAGKAVIANAEDGHTYRWDLATNSLSDLKLNAARGEAYTPTLIGPDGTVYAINNARLYALGQ